MKKKSLNKEDVMKVANENAKISKKQDRVLDEFSNMCELHWCKCRDCLIKGKYIWCYVEMDSHEDEDNEEAGCPFGSPNQLS